MHNIMVAVYSSNCNQDKTVYWYKSVNGEKESPSYQDYRSNASDLNEPPTSKLTIVNRFDWILNNLHLNDVIPACSTVGHNTLYSA